MYIAPSTNIKLLKGVPLDNTYDHTLYFEDANSQANYFASMAKYTFNNNTYQRVNKGTMRIGVCADNIYDCNYMMFQNTNFGTKWFYAFINSIEYINNDVTEIEYEIDDMQTWYFDYDIEQCFVERHHPKQDWGYWNTQPEPVDVGEYVHLNQSKLIEENLCIYLMFTPYQLSGVWVGDGGVYDGVYTGNQLMAFKTSQTGINKLKDFLQGLDTSGKADKVISIYMGIEIENLPWEDDFCAVPTDRIGRNTIIFANANKNTSIPWNNGLLVSNLPLGSDDPDSTTAYIPKNRKLYTYPYNFCCVYNGSGESLNLRYEYGTAGNHIHSGEIDLQFISNLLQPVQSSIIPVNYKGITETNYDGQPVPADSDFGLLTEKVSITNYPQCSWTTDIYKNWVARDMFPTLISGGFGIASTASMLEGKTTQLQQLRGGLSVQGTILSAISGTLSQGISASLASNVTRGNSSSGGALKSHNGLTYFSSRVTVSAENAQKIDQFFTMFGYAQNTVYAPLQKTRENFTYIKTKGCHINSKNATSLGLPSDAQKHICGIYDDGITFWVDPTKVGDYTVSNKPLDEITQGE